jgi:hypothetical protein
VVSSLNTEDGSREFGFKKLPNGDAIMDIAQVVVENLSFKKVLFINNVNLRNRSTQGVVDAFN